MARKKWTAKSESEVTDTVLKFREKRKWQLAFRRYIIEGNPSEAYARYFGLDINHYKNWISLQFSDELNWDNFGTLWQFDHIVPVAYFDFSNTEDLILCWNFINIRVEKLESHISQTDNIDILSARGYFENLYQKTGYSLCQKMLEKLDKIANSGTEVNPNAEKFIIDHKEELEKMTTLSADEFSRLNRGMSLSDILLEREILRKFG